MEKVLIRASSLGKIMVDDPGSKITERQLETLNGLLSKIKLTEKQAQLRDTLLLKRDSKPKLSIGAKTYIKELWLYNNYGIKQNISSKYIEKGNEVEGLSIQLVETIMELGKLSKNDVHYKNDYICGTPDVVTNDLVIDVKSTWSAATFPFFDDKIKNNMYLWQLKAYMWLTGLRKSYLCYCLVPTPETLIEDEMRRVSWKRGELGEVSDQVEDEVREFHSLEKIPILKRIKSFQVNLHDSDIEQIKNKIKLVREYYKELSNNK